MKQGKGFYVQLPSEVVKNANNILIEKTKLLKERAKVLKMKDEELEEKGLSKTSALFPTMEDLYKISSIEFIAEIIGAEVKNYEVDRKESNVMKSTNLNKLALCSCSCHDKPGVYIDEFIPCCDLSGISFKNEDGTYREDWLKEKGFYVSNIDQKNLETLDLINGILNGF